MARLSILFSFELRGSACVCEVGEQIYEFEKICDQIYGYQIMYKVTIYKVIMFTHQYAISGAKSLGKKVTREVTCLRNQCCTSRFSFIIEISSNFHYNSNLISIAHVMQRWLMFWGPQKF